MEVRVIINRLDDNDINIGVEIISSTDTFTFRTPSPARISCVVLAPHKGSMKMKDPAVQGAVEKAKSAEGSLATRS